MFEMRDKMEEWGRNILENFQNFLFMKFKSPYLNPIRLSKNKKKYIQYKLAGKFISFHDSHQFTTGRLSLSHFFLVVAMLSIFPSPCPLSLSNSSTPLCCGRWVTPTLTYNSWERFDGYILIRRKITFSFRNNQLSKSLSWSNLLDGKIFWNVI